MYPAAGFNTSSKNFQRHAEHDSAYPFYQEIAGHSSTTLTNHARNVPLKNHSISELSDIIQCVAFLPCGTILSFI